MIDEKLYTRCKEESCSEDFVAQFDSYEKYKEWGLGVIIQKNGEIVAGASSYTRYKEGIEIEIDTKERFYLKEITNEQKNI